VTCYMTNPSSCQGGRPVTNKTAIVLTTAETWSCVPEGLNAKTDWLTYWLTVSCWLLTSVSCWTVNTN